MSNMTTNTKTDMLKLLRPDWTEEDLAVHGPNCRCGHSIYNHEGGQWPMEQCCYLDCDCITNATWLSSTIKWEA